LTSSLTALSLRCSNINVLTPWTRSIAAACPRLSRLELHGYGETEDTRELLRALQKGLAPGGAPLLALALPGCWCKTQASKVLDGYLRNGK